MKKTQTFPEQIWQFFCSVKLAVYTLVCLATTSIIGTVILQNGSDQQYLQLYGQTWTNLIKVFNIDDMYHAAWFLGLIVILCINIVVCSIERLGITWKVIFPKKIKVNPQRFKRQKLVDPFTVQKDSDTVLSMYESFLTKNVGKVIAQDSDAGRVLYAEKGRWTRIGVYIVHVSILLLLIGALIGAMFGFKANLRLDEGAASDTAFLVNNGTPVKLGFQIRCNDFEVKFYDTGAPEEFRSNLTIIENGKESFTKDIRVNHPLRYKGINVFQSSYGTARPDAIKVQVMRTADKKSWEKTIKIGQELSIPEKNGTFKLEGFLPQFDFKGHNLGETFVLTVTPEKGESFQVGLPIKFPTFDKMRKGDYAFIIQDFEQRHYTGLQITKDPGVWYVYAGFILMIIGCWVTFFMSHQSYFLEITTTDARSCEVFVSATSNRGKQGLKLKLNKMVTKLKDI